MLSNREKQLIIDALKTVKITGNAQEVMIIAGEFAEIIRKLSPPPIEDNGRVAEIPEDELTPV